jgi:hypothetical protein
LQTNLGEFEEARNTLRTAFGVPANVGYDEIIHWMVAAHRLDAAAEESGDFDLSPGRRAELRRALFAYFEKANLPAKALALAEAAPNFVVPSWSGRLRAAAAAAQEFERGAKFLEKLASQASNPGDYSLDLALLLGDWARTEVAAGKADSALGHLKTAHEQRPELFEITWRLSNLQQERGDRQGAIQTLESYLAVAKNPAETEKARALLAKLHAGG